MIKKLIQSSINNFQSHKFSDIQDRIKNYKYVSFDIFDTLIKRDVPEPMDLFEIVASRCKIIDFKEKRIFAEQKARKLSKNGEVTLDEIYDAYVGEDKQLLKKLELECEINLCVANLDMLPIYKYCVKQTRVLLITDMYLPRDTIETILKKNNITEYEKLFISNEVGMTKVDGKLFDYVAKQLEIVPNLILHIGNSMKADYLMAMKKKWATIKVATFYNRLQRNYSNLLCADKFKFNCLNTFINNHTYGENIYFKFGYETLGPLLYGFINWIFDELKRNDIEEVFFLSRDGYIMKMIYDDLNYNMKIPSVYFEVSRRSLRVPSYNRKQTFEEIVAEITVPNMTNIIQIFDSFGLDAKDYGEVIERYGFTFDEQLKRDSLSQNNEFRKLFEQVKAHILSNATLEKEALLKYIHQFDFSKKIAIIDIGWGGSMQKYLLHTLDEMNIKHNITGYYIGLTKKSKINLGKEWFSAKGYAFDCLNNVNDYELESSFIGLIETLFLEQNGSVRNYYIKDGYAYANRYEYEYGNIMKGFDKEAINVQQIQQGAISFVKTYNKSILCKYIGTDSNIMFNNIYAVGTYPVKKNIMYFGDFEFFNCGNKVYLAKPKMFLYYLVHPKALKRDLFESQWKTGFMKALLRIKLPYLKIFKVLRKEANR